MNIEFTARHFHAPEFIREYAQAEVQRINHYFARAVSCHIILIHEHNEYTTELNLLIPQHKLNVKQTDENLTKSIDRAVATMISRVTKVKDKMKAH